MRGRKKQQRGCLPLSRATPMPRESESLKQATSVELFSLFYFIYQLGQKRTKQVDKRRNQSNKETETTEQPVCYSRAKYMNNRVTRYKNTLINQKNK